MNDRYGFLTDPHRKSFNALTRNALQQLLSKSHPPAYRRHVITTWTLNLSGREDLTVQGALVKKKINGDRLQPSVDVQCFHCT